MILTTNQAIDCRTDLLTFTSTMHQARKGAPFRRNWHQAAICAALERVVLGKIKRLIINEPPRSGKTELAVINFIAWSMGNFPDSEFIHASYSKRLATANTFHARAVMQHEAFAEIFGPPVLLAESNAKDEFRTADGGVVYAAGSEGTITGYGAGKMRDKFGGAILIDDPHKAGEASSRVMRENVIDWFITTMESRKNTPTTPIILVMQRLHADDLAGFLLAGGNGEKWHNLVIPAIDEDGVSFWPDQYPIADLRRLEKADSYRFAGQYQQAPVILGGNIIKTAWFRRYDPATAPRFAWRKIYADTAQKTAEANDYTVFQCWGKGHDGNAYLIDQIRGKWEAPELLRTAADFWNKHKAVNAALYGPLRAMAVEDKSSGTGLIQELRRAGGVAVVGIQRDRDKYSRVLDVLGYIESGQVWLPAGVPWMSDFLVECEAFTASDNHPHDDQIDPMVDAIDDMLGAGTNAVERLRAMT